MRIKGKRKDIGPFSKLLKALFKIPSFAKYFNQMILTFFLIEITSPCDQMGKKKNLQALLYEEKTEFELHKTSLKMNILAL